MKTTWLFDTQLQQMQLEFVKVEIVMVDCNHIYCILTVLTACTLNSQIIKHAGFESKHIPDNCINI